MSHTKTKPEQYLGTPEAAALLAVNRARIKALAAEGRIGRKVGSRWLFTRSELEAFRKLDRPTGLPVAKHPKPRK